MAQLITSSITNSVANGIQLPIGTSAQRPIFAYRTPGTYTWVAPTGVTSIQVLVVGGGGGGSNYNSAGGGGAGGLIYNSAFAVTPGSSYTVTVGAGGRPAIGQADGSLPALNGGNSVFATLTAFGGGNGGQGNAYGGTRGTADVLPGSGNGTVGSGGGARHPSVPAGGIGTTGQGNAGGASGTYGTNYPGGGGGGAGGAGGAGNAAGTIAGAGGVGVANSITGVATWYAGGGGGSVQSGGTGGQGGRGGGGRGGGPEINYCGQDGYPGTGGGGGAGGYGGSTTYYSPANTRNGGWGGSGIVVISTLTVAQSPLGLMRFNTDLGDIEIWDGYEWNSFQPFNGTITSQLASPSRLAPSSIINAYTGDLSDRVTMALGAQYVTIPYTGWYRIGAYGAQGGCNSVRRGGGGTAAIGDFRLLAGQVIKCVVGSAGGTHTSDCDSGGGGATYVLQEPYDTVDSILVIGAGGGGASNTYNSVIGSRFKTSQEGADGKNANSGRSGVSGDGGDAGTGGGYGFRNKSGSAGNPGGGFFAGGGATNPNWSSTSGGFCYLDTPSGQGGVPNNANAFGGFGGAGGGGGHGDCFISGGGGGGFNGGGTRIQYTNTHGGCGGGSYNNGLNQENLGGINWNGKTGSAGNMGYVTIQRIR